MELSIERRVDWPAWLFAAVAVGVFILAHGCHGPNEDHELFAPAAVALNIEP